MVWLFLLHFWVVGKDNKIKGPCKERKQICASKIKMNTTEKGKINYTEALNAFIAMVVSTVHLKVGILELGAIKCPGLSNRLQFPCNRVLVSFLWKLWSAQLCTV